VKKYHKFDLEKAPEKGFALCYYTTGVEFGIYNKTEGFMWEDKHLEENLLEMHIFDFEKEFRVIKSNICENGYLVAPIIEDSSEIKSDDSYIAYDDEYMMLYGENWVNSDKNKITVCERGTKKTFYLPLTAEDFKKGIFLKVRNYIDFDENNMFISNYRLCGIFIKNDKEYKAVDFDGK